MEIEAKHIIGALVYLRRRRLGQLQRMISCRVYAGAVGSSQLSALEDALRHPI